MGNIFGKVIGMELAVDQTGIVVESFQLARPIRNNYVVVIGCSCATTATSALQITNGCRLYHIACPEEQHESPMYRCSFFFLVLYLWTHARRHY